MYCNYFKNASTGWKKDNYQLCFSSIIIFNSFKKLLLCIFLVSLVFFGIRIRLIIDVDPKHCFSVLHKCKHYLLKAVSAKKTQELTRQRTAFFGVHLSDTNIKLSFIGKICMTEA